MKAKHAIRWTVLYPIAFEKLEPQGGCILSPTRAVSIHLETFILLWTTRVRGNTGKDTCIRKT